MDDTTKTVYNKFELFPELSYNCITYLLENNTTIWKLLKYPTSDAWNLPDLTSTEKRDLIYAGQTNINDYRVFQDSGADDSILFEACFLRISPLELYPRNYIVGNVTMGFEVYCHYKINTMSNYRTRVDTIIQSIIASLNGQEVGGLGRLYFDAKANPRCKVLPIGSIPYRGKGLIMCNWTL